MTLETIRAQLESRLDTSIGLISIAVDEQLQTYEKRSVIPLRESKETKEAISNYHSNVKNMEGEYGKHITEIVDFQKYENKIKNELNRLKKVS